VTDKPEGMWKELAVAQCNVLSLNLVGGTEEDHENLSAKPVCAELKYK
jgi:hypothetical protein